MEGKGFTVIVTAAVLLQPLTSVPVIEYVVVVTGSGRSVQAAMDAASDVAWQ